MREIIFRGKRLDNGEWVEGYFCNENCDDIAMPMYEQANIIKKGTGVWHPVDPETVGQHIGLKDAKGNKIFEGDILCQKWELDNDELPYVAVVEYGVFNCSCCHGVYGWTYNEGNIRDYYKYVVIGNIHDNHDLIEAMEGHR